MPISVNEMNILRPNTTNHFHIMNEYSTERFSVFTYKYDLKHNHLYDD